MTGLQFAKTAVRDVWVGALTKSSRFVIQRVVASLPAGASILVEYGPGDGVLTKGLLGALPPRGRLCVIEKVHHFLPELRSLGDERLAVLHGDVLREAPRLLERTQEPLDAVISGIPFTFFKPRDRDAIVRATAAALRPGGRFIVYQYSPLMKPVLERHFTSVRISYEPRNFPPYFVIVAER